MKLFIKLRNKCFTACMALALLVLASIGVFKVSLPRSVEASMVKFDNEKSVTITNGSFTSFSSSSKYPYSLSNYTITGNSTPSMKAGAINVSDKEFKDHYEDYGLTEYSNPGKTGDDNYILMINTDEDSNYTYASKEFTLAANGYYYVTVSAKTIGDSSVASVFLMKDNKVFEDCLIQNITSNGWANYTFFVETNSYESVTLQFGMQIGSQSTRASGCVLFDELHAAQISRETFANCISTFPEDSFKIAHFREKNAYKAYMFDEHIIDFSQDVNNPSITNANYFADSVSGGGEKTVDINNGILNISTNGTYVNYTGQEEELLANSTYKFTIEVNASEISSGSAFVKLEEILDDEEEYDDFMESTTDDIEAKSSKLTLTTKTSNTLTKGYDEYTIYVRTGALKDSKVKFSFGFIKQS